MENSGENMEGFDTENAFVIEFNSMDRMTQTVFGQEHARTRTSILNASVKFGLALRLNKSTLTLIPKNGTKEEHIAKIGAIVSRVRESAKTDL